MTTSITSLAGSAGMRFPVNLTNPSSESAGTINFQELLMKSMGDMAALSQRAQGSVETSLVGGDLSLVESLTAVREADLALRLMMQLRNKLMEAYQEVQQLRM